MEELQLIEAPIKSEEDKLKEIHKIINESRADLKEIYAKLSQRQDRILNKIRERKTK